MLATHTETGQQGTNYWGRQLSLDQLSTQDTVAGKTQAILSSGAGNLRFKIETMDNNSFSLKISHKGQSYLLSGVYVQDRVRSPYWWDMSASMIRIVRFDNILACRDGRYTIPVHHGREREELQNKARDILNGPRYGKQTLH